MTFCPYDIPTSHVRVSLSTHAFRAGAFPKETEVLSKFCIISHKSPNEQLD